MISKIKAWFTSEDKEDSYYFLIPEKLTKPNKYSKWGATVVECFGFYDTVEEGIFDGEYTTHSSCDDFDSFGLAWKHVKERYQNFYRSLLSTYRMHGNYIARVEDGLVFKLPKQLEFKDNVAMNLPKGFGLDWYIDVKDNGTFKYNGKRFGTLEDAQRALIEEYKETIRDHSPFRTSKPKPEDIIAPAGSEEGYYPFQRTGYLNQRHQRYSIYAIIDRLNQEQENG